jgi:mannosyltransferase OCH1-like enzyme
MYLTSGRRSKIKTPINKIPKIIHQIWIGPYNIPLREKQFCKNIQDLHKDEYTYMFWTDTTMLNAEMPDEIQKVYNKFYSDKDFAFCADVLRVWVVYNYGGFYLDVDFDCKKKLDYFFTYSNLFFYHNDLDTTIPCGLFAGSKHSNILKYLVDHIKLTINWYGPSWMGNTIRKYYGFDDNTKQNEIKNKMIQENNEYYSYSEFENIYARHFGLNSWCPEMSTRFKTEEQL